ncbi:GL26074 [Drosophila persimilis]|uniref:GL26074 n=1 Tax=Drosophila persimilis TaxID=7234 RepID=B4GKF9_DROPE|nr:GL26074 [Drosophila persimilis]
MILFLVAVAPPLLQVSFSRPTSLHEQQQQQHQQQQQQQQLEQEQQLETQQQQQQAYADAYTALGRGQYESTARAPNNSKV